MKDNNVIAFYCNNCHEIVCNCEHNFEQLHEKGLCAKCYREQNYYEYQVEIDQLKQQLAETEQRFLEFQEDSIRNEQIYVRELAEKDKEIEKLKQQYTILENENGKLTTELIMDKYKKAQKEVSFGKQLAIQELEKVKELLLIESKNNPIVYDVNDDTVGGALDRDKTFEIIDQQIKELKGE